MSGFQRNGIELYLPFVLRELINRDYSKTPRSAKMLIEKVIVKFTRF